MQVDVVGPRCAIIPKMAFMTMPILSQIKTYVMKLNNNLRVNRSYGKVCSTSSLHHNNHHASNHKRRLCFILQLPFCEQFQCCRALQINHNGTGYSASLLFSFTEVFTDRTPAVGYLARRNEGSPVVYQRFSPSKPGLGQNILFFFFFFKSFI